MMLIYTLPLCRRSRRLEISYHTNYQRLVLGDGDDAVMERRGSGGGGGSNGGEKETTVRCWKTLVWKWSGLQCKWILIFNSYITFLGNVSVLLVDDDDDILPAVLICWCHVRRLSDDEKNCLSPHGSTGRDGPRPTLHDPAMMMMTMMSDGTWPTSCSCSALLCSALEYPRVATCTSCNHLIRRHTHHTHTYSQHLATYLHYLHSQPNKTRKRREELKVPKPHNNNNNKYGLGIQGRDYTTLPTTAQSINPRCLWYQETMIKASKQRNFLSSQRIYN